MYLYLYLNTHTIKQEPVGLIKEVITKDKINYQSQILKEMCKIPTKKNFKALVRYPKDLKQLKNIPHSYIKLNVIKLSTPPKLHYKFLAFQIKWLGIKKIVKLTLKLI